MQDQQANAPEEIQDMSNVYTLLATFNNRYTKQALPARPPTVAKSTVYRQLPATVCRFGAGKP